MNTLIQKYNKPIPRYTSYPTSPVWSDDIHYKSYTNALKNLNSDESLALYIHLPFCKSLCNYCGCHVFIRATNEKANPYLSNLEKEIQLVSNTLKTKREVKQIHFGGGSPSFISEQQFEKIMRSIMSNFTIATDAEIAIEADPRTVSLEKLELYRNLGVNRISFGVQDLNEDVQKEINRIQSYELIFSLVSKCRELGYKSINLDLIYGLPKQTIENFQETVDKVIQINPDRIAMFGYAHIPWIKKHQNKMDIKSIPEPPEKLSIFLKSRERLLNAGYEAIGMDHFSKPDDELTVAFNNNHLYRNFMGYTVENIDNIIGFGVSSIGKIGHAFYQNVKTLKEYDAYLSSATLPVDRGIVLTNDDIIRQYVILCVMCRFEVDKNEIEQKFNIVFNDYFSIELQELSGLEEDNLLTLTDNKLIISDTGRFFVRNIANIFDEHFRNQIKKQRFSQSV